jgi:hypothetical protein
MREWVSGDVTMPTTRKPKTPADYAIWRARCILDWMQAAFDGTGDYPAEYLAGQIALEMRILTTEAKKQRKDGGR